MPDDTRTIETEIEIDAPVEAVWKALTDADELANWFPLKSRVKPGVGGHVWTYFAEDMQWEVPIAAWEPNKYLRLVWCPAGEDHGVENAADASEDLRLLVFMAPHPRADRL